MLPKSWRYSSQTGDCADSSPQSKILRQWSGSRGGSEPRDWTRALAAWMPLPCAPSNLAEQPGAGVGPIAFGGRFGNAKCFCGLFVGQTHEVAELDQVGFARMLGSETVKRFVYGEQSVFVFHRRGNLGGRTVDADAL